LTLLVVKHIILYKSIDHKIIAMKTIQSNGAIGGVTLHAAASAAELVAAVHNNLERVETGACVDVNCLILAA
jgi:hypothetical protein